LHRAIWTLVRDVHFFKDKKLSSSSKRHLVSEEIYIPVKTLFFLYYF
jgi:hypothetical protein